MTEALCAYTHTEFTNLELSWLCDYLLAHFLCLHLFKKIHILFNAVDLLSSIVNKMFQYYILTNISEIKLALKRCSAKIYQYSMQEKMEKLRDYIRSIFH